MGGSQTGLWRIILPSRTLSADLSLIRDICNELGPDPAVVHEVKGASRVGLHGLSVKTDSPALEALASLQFAEVLPALGISPERSPQSDEHIFEPLPKALCWPEQEPDWEKAQDAVRRDLKGEDAAYEFIECMRESDHEFYSEHLHDLFLQDPLDEGDVARVRELMLRDIEDAKKLYQPGRPFLLQGVLARLHATNLLGIANVEGEVAFLQAFTSHPWDEAKEIVPGEAENIEALRQAYVDAGEPDELAFDPGQAISLARSGAMAKLGFRIISDRGWEQSE